MAAVYIQGVFGQGPRADFENHRREFAGCMVILLHGIGQALSGGEIHRASASHRKRRGSALGRMFPFALDRDLGLAENVQFSMGEGLLVDLSTFGGRGDRVEDPSVRHPGFDVLRDELIAVAGNGYSGVFGTATVLPPGSL